MGSKQKNKAVFFDRDGTINVEKNYVFRIEDFEFQPGIIELMRQYYKQGYLLFVITNQSGIARQFYSEADYRKLSKWMCQQLQKEGIEITKNYHCPHHPEITGDCNCRKPKPGMIVEAISEYNIDAANSILIGDSERDILAGKNAGIGKNLYIQDLLAGGIFF